MPKCGVAYITFTITREEYIEFLDWFMIPSCYNPVLPSPDQTASDTPPSYVALAYGGVSTLSLFRSLFTLGPAGDWVTFQKRSEVSVPLILTASMLYVPDWKSKFIFSYLERSPLHPAIFVEVWGKEVVEPSNVGLKRKRFEGVGGRAFFPISAGRRSGSLGPLSTFREDVSPDPFFLSHPEFQRLLDGLSLTELANFHDVVALKLMLSGVMLNRDTRSLSSKVLKLLDEVFALKNEKLKSATIIARLEVELLCIKGSSPTEGVASVRDLEAENRRLKEDIAGLQELSSLVKSSKELLKVDVKALRSKCCKFEENEAVMLATKASLKTKLEVLKEKLESTNEDLSLMVTDLLPHVVKTLLSSDSFSTLLDDLQRKVMLVSMAQAFEEVVGMDLDLLAYHSKMSLGLLKSLEPPSLPSRKSSGAGPSSSPFLGYTILARFIVSWAHSTWGSSSTHPLCVLPSLLSIPLTVSLFVTLVNPLPCGWILVNGFGMHRSFGLLRPSLCAWMASSIPKCFHSNFPCQLLIRGQDTANEVNDANLIKAPAFLFWLLLMYRTSVCQKLLSSSVENKRILNCYYCWFKLQLLVGVTTAAQD
ncbi:hypothetical protein Tco_0602438 [Tanacetum coccineum]